MYEVAFRTAKKVVAILEKKGRSVDGASNDEAESEIEPSLLSCYDIGEIDDVWRCRRVNGGMSRLFFLGTELPTSYLPTMSQAVEMASAITQTLPQALAAVTSMTPMVLQRLITLPTLPGIGLQPPE